MTVLLRGDELSKLAKLKEQGIITEEEFSRMKDALMKRDVVTAPITIMNNVMGLSIRNYSCFLSSPITKVTVFIVSHFSHFAPKSDIFQNAVGVG
jgi:hypothetical protein